MFESTRYKKIVEETRIIYIYISYHYRKQIYFMYRNDKQILPQ